MRNKYVGQDVRARLSGTYIRWRGNPYYCEVDQNGDSIALYSLVDGSMTVRVSSDDPDLDISSLDLGYVNTSKRYKCCVYFQRNPYRRYKQGVEPQSLSTFPRSSNYGPGDIPAHGINSEEFYDSMCGKFPAYKVALSMITSPATKYESVALSRDVAVQKDKDMLRVWIKKDQVAFIKLSDSNRVYIPKTELSWVHELILSSACSSWVLEEGIPK